MISKKTGMRYCCNKMKKSLSPKGPDTVFTKHTDNSICLFTYDGGTMMRIKFCPWCGEEIRRAEENKEMLEMLRKSMAQVRAGKLTSHGSFLRYK